MKNVESAIIPLECTSITVLDILEDNILLTSGLYFHEDVPSKWRDRLIRSKITKFYDLSDAKVVDLKSYKGFIEFDDDEDNIQPMNKLYSRADKKCTTLLAKRTNGDPIIIILFGCLND